MMISWRTYVLSILVCTFLCGVLSHVIADTQGKKVIQLLSGVLLAITVLSPFTKIRFKDYLQIPDVEWDNSDFYIMEGQRTAAEAQKRYITDYCEAYILDRAKIFDTEMTVQISLNDEMVPVFVEIQCHGDPKVQAGMENVITADLGIPKENQKWIWNQENNRS